MEGIEILATEEVAVAWTSWNWLGFFGGVVIAVGVFALIGNLIGLTEGAENGWICFIAGSIIGGAILGISMGANLVEPIEYETHYEVAISEDVSMIEFLEKYEVVDQRGKIFVIKEREEVE